MKTFKAYLKEYRDEEEQIKNDLVKFSLPWIKKYYANAPKNIKLLYRGLSGNSHRDIINTHDERRPKDSSNLFHKVWGSVFENNFGINYRSNNICFTYPNRDRAGQYGSATFYVFPKGPKFSWCSSRKVDDLFSISNSTLLGKFIKDHWEDFEADFLDILTKNKCDKTSIIMNKLRDGITLFFAGNVRFDTLKDVLEMDENLSYKVYSSIFPELGYKENKFDHTDYSEVMIYCKEYYVIDVNEIERPGLEMMLGEILNENR